jgi:indolepyruvate ferredoxin oxidoreductase
MSRYTGLYVGLKALADTVESAAVVDASPWRESLLTPDDVCLPIDGVSIRWPDDRWSQEKRLFEYKLPALMAYVRANKLNPVTFTHPKARLGIIASGKAWLDLQQALADFRMGPRELLHLGIRICKMQVPWPLDRTSMLEFTSGLKEIAVVEEKEPLIEPQLRDLLYCVPERSRPRVSGKSPFGPNTLGLPVTANLDAVQVARAVGAWLLQFEELPAVSQHIERLQAKDRELQRATASHVRAPYYCSGCPHNTSTKVPEDSIAMAGVGCHYLSLFIYPEQTRTFTVMGTEGSNWVGLAPFTRTPHVFVNLGEGSYFHSSVLAIRQSVAARVNVTYRILYNDAVAMTGGQAVDGPLTVSRLVKQLQAEGLAKIVVVAEDLDAQRSALALPDDMAVRPRSQLDAVQRQLRETPGCTALVYVQTCAAEKRRRRKKKRFPDPPRRIFIHPEVCEGCGDCGRQSNCISVVPHATDLGVKRAIDQSNCNKDFSCLQGFCPSFITVEGGAPKRAAGRAHMVDISPLPDPLMPPHLDRPYNVLITGIGGTGVITIGALLGMAAHLEGKAVSVLDMTGMAQKNGGVQSHIRVATTADLLTCSRIPATSADLVIACDLLEAAGREALSKVARARTRIVANSDVMMPGGFAQNPERFSVSADGLREIVLQHVDADQLHCIEATSLATALVGDSIASNVFMLGLACQLGLIPVSVASLQQAIELNGVAVSANMSALNWGRQAALHVASVRQAAFPERAVGTRTASEPSATRAPRNIEPVNSNELAHLIKDRHARLKEYGSEIYSRRYLDLVELVRKAESAATPGSLTLTKAVATHFYRLLAIKDEYEVARLFTRSPFLHEVEQSFAGNFRINFHMAPPMLAKKDSRTGVPLKRVFGPWLRPLLGILASLRGLRETMWDPFRLTTERRTERRLRDDYEQLIRELCRGLGPAILPVAVDLASLPDRIRGFGHVKEASIREAELERRRLLQQLAQLGVR